MAPSSDVATSDKTLTQSAAYAKKRNLDTASVSGSSTSDESTRKRKHRSRKNGKKRAATTTTTLAVDGLDIAPVNGDGHSRPGAFEKRRGSLGKAARDPRDEPPTKKRVVVVPGAGAVTRSPSPVIDSDGLSRPSIGTRKRREETKEEEIERFDKMKGAVRTILECIGEDPDREGLLETPSRYAKALLFLTSGYQVSVEDATNGALFHEGHNEMVIVKDIEIYSLCEHHMVPFTGKMHIGYIPSDTVIGLSKLPRIAEMFARRLQIQERLTKEVAHAIMEILKPQGVAVVMESSHLCMVMRGVQKTGATTITSCVLGCFERKSKTRNEFLSLVGVNRR